MKKNMQILVMVIVALVSMFTADVKAVAAKNILVTDYDINCDSKTDIIDVILMKQILLEDAPNDKNFKAVHLVRLLQYILGIGELSDEPIPPVQEPTGSNVVEEMNAADIELIPEFFSYDNVTIFSDITNGIHTITRIKEDGTLGEIKFKEQFGIQNEEYINICYIGEVENKLFLFYQKEDETFACAWASSIGRLVAKENRIDLTKVKQTYGTNELIKLVCDWTPIEQNINDNIIETKFIGPMDHVISVIVEASDKSGDYYQIAGVIPVMDKPQKYIVYWDDSSYYGYLTDLD